MVSVCLTVMAALLAADPGTQAGAIRIASAGTGPAELAEADVDALAVGGGVAVTPMPSHVSDFVQAALPEPPEVVIRQTRMYGTVAVDHRLHLAVRASCRTCHGNGPAGKIVFESPKAAHNLCIGCHKERTAGPTSCSGCHSKNVETKSQQLAVVPGTDTTAEQPAKAGVIVAPVPAHKPAAAAAPCAPCPPCEPEELAAGPSSNTLELGFTSGPQLSPALRFSSLRQGWLRVYSLERVSAPSSTRLLTLFGFGMVRDLRPRWDLTGEAVLGFDAQEQPRVAFSPAVGVRGGIEWEPPASWMVTSMRATLTCLSDFAPRTVGEQEDRFRVYLTLATGFRPRPR